MDVDKAVAQVSAAGIELTDRRRNDDGNGWRLSFANGAIVDIHDDGQIAAAGKGADEVARILEIAAKPGEG